MGRSTPEGRLKTFVLGILKEAVLAGQPLYYWAPQDAQGGIPDIVGAYRDRPLAIELKAAKGTLTRPQAETLNAWKRAAPHGIVGVLKATDDTPYSRSPLQWVVSGAGSIVLPRATFFPELIKLYFQT